MQRDASPNADPPRSPELPGDAAHSHVEHARMVRNSKVVLLVCSEASPGMVGRHNQVDHGQPSVDTRPSSMPWSTRLSGTRMHDPQVVCEALVVPTTP